MSSRRVSYFPILYDLAGGGHRRLFLLRLRTMRDGYLSTCCFLYLRIFVESMGVLIEPLPTLLYRAAQNSKKKGRGKQRLNLEKFPRARRETRRRVRRQRMQEGKREQPLGED